MEHSRQKLTDTQIDHLRTMYCAYVPQTVASTLLSIAPMTTNKYYTRFRLLNIKRFTLETFTSIKESLHV
jgi:hypothetical protein